MEKNIGKTDRVIRFVVGIILIYLAFIVDNRLSIMVITAFATISIMESMSGFCGIYKLFNIRTISTRGTKSTRR